MESFDEIYILNLHGNARRGESDENVFDIQQGVAIALFVKLREGKHKAEECKVYYRSIVHDDGKMTREEKYEYLRTNSWKTLEWNELKPKEPYYFFVPKDLSLEEEYSKFPKLDEIFVEESSGIQTQNDEATITFTKSEIETRIIDFVKLSEDELRKKYKIKDRSVWNLRTARASVISDHNKFDQNFEKMLTKRVAPILYKPFEIRWTYYLPESGKFLARPRYNIMKHFLLGSNVGLVAIRQVILKEDGPYNHFLVSNLPIGERVFQSNRSQAHIFPLYLYSDDGKTRKPNLKPEFLEELRKRYGNITPEDFLYYTYAVLHDPKYRKRYAEFLKFDFPRIPLYDKETFDKYKEIGKELVELHLMKKDFSISPQVEGDELTVEKVKYDKKKQGVWINKTTILLSIPEEVWEYKVGGYRVIEKYLKGRKRRELTLEEIEHIYKVVEIIKRTIELVKELEKIKPRFDDA